MKQKKYNPKQPHPTSTPFKQYCHKNYDLQVKMSDELCFPKKKKLSHTSQSPFIADPPPLPTNNEIACTMCETLSTRFGLFKSTQFALLNHNVLSSPDLFWPE